MKSVFRKFLPMQNLWNGDIVARGVDKAVAVKWLKEHFPQIEKIRCIGDSVNDLGMVRAYQGAVPDVADPEIKKEATQIVKSVAEFLENFLNKDPDQNFRSKFKLKSRFRV